MQDYVLSENDFSKFAVQIKLTNMERQSVPVLLLTGYLGSGKTTLVNLISRLYDVNEGTISIDGIDVRELAFHDLRRNVAMVSQDTYIFMGTVADNIAYANPEATRGDIIQAAILASAHEFISNMPDAYDTVIGASGKDLSGGEKQRVAVARALVNNPAVILADEPSGSLDSHNRSELHRLFFDLRDTMGATFVIVTHDESLAADSDCVVRMADGRIKEITVK